MGPLTPSAPPFMLNKIDVLASIQSIAISD